MNAPVQAEHSEAGLARLHCAELWGGTSAREEDIVTPGVSATLYSNAGGDQRGGDIYYFSVCAYETITRVALADVRGHGEAVSHLSEWLYDSLERRMNDFDGAAVLSDLNDLVCARGFEALTTATVATFHRDRRRLCYASAGHPPMLFGSAQNDWRRLTVDAADGPSNLPLGVFRGTLYTRRKRSVFSPETGCCCTPMVFPGVLVLKTVSMESTD